MLSGRFCFSAAKILGQYLLNKSSVVTVLSPVEQKQNLNMEIEFCKFSEDFRLCLSFYEALILSHTNIPRMFRSVALNSPYLIVYHLPSTATCVILNA